MMMMMLIVMMIREGDVTLPRFPQSNYKLGPGGSSRLLKSNICERCEGWGLLLRQVKSAYLSQSFSFTKSHSVKRFPPCFPSFLRHQVWGFYEGLDGQHHWTKKSTILTKSKSQDFHAEFSGTRGMLYCLCILKYVLVCLGMAVEQPLENQCQRRATVSTVVGTCQYVSVLWGTLGYSWALKGTCKYLWILGDIWGWSIFTFANFGELVVEHQLYILSSIVLNALH